MRKPQLFFLHFAGGNCYSFQFILSLLQDFEVITIELPGRGKRMQECLLKDFDLAAEDIYTQVMSKLRPSKFMIYGHSMGAYLGLRVSGLLEKKNLSPGYLIVSGNAGPGVRDLKKRHLMPHDEFLGELATLGGIQAEFFESKELMDMFMPVLRADFEVAEENGLDHEAPVTAPIYAMMGDQEEKVDEIANWGRFTRNAFCYEILSGDHFFIRQHPERIAAIIKECYDQITRH